ncbi:cyclophilin-like fold protein [Bacillus nitratireducens]|uniref:cyclophilin-like fold protein n=1 Tax=Bacillus nitratireducens TaxID=2026193 RepID=UPI002E7A0BA3|nr:cyclophilin-like fold protein [Bacillus nitratireducens]
MSNVLVKLKFENEEVIVRMENTPTAQDFLSLLPMKLTIEDYAGTEKISYLPRKLSVEGTSNGIEAKRGDFNYYAPWGNVAIFYHDFRFSKGLIKLGAIESGIEKLEHHTSNFEMVIEKVE